MARIAVCFSVLMLLNSPKAFSQLDLARWKDSSSRTPGFRVLPQNFYNQHLPFTCKKEVQLQKLVSLPVFIRLGSKDYVDYLEKKPNGLAKRP